MALRVVLAEDNLLVREGVRRVLDAETDLHLVATCGDLDELLRAVDNEQPDVVVTDIRMPPTGSDEGIPQPKNSVHDTRRSESSC